MSSSWNVQRVLSSTNSLKKISSVRSYLLALVWACLLPPFGASQLWKKGASWKKMWYCVCRKWCPLDMYDGSNVFFLIFRKLLKLFFSLDFLHWTQLPLHDEAYPHPQKTLFWLHSKQYHLMQEEKKQEKGEKEEKGRNKTQSLRPKLSSHFLSSLPFDLSWATE